MLRLIATIFLVVAGTLQVVSSSFSADTLIRVYGNLKALKDSSNISVSVSVMYEKLPYYDDLGTTRTRPDGSFEFYLRKGNEYNINCNVPDYIKFNTTIKAIDMGNQSMNLDLYIDQEQEEELITLNNLEFGRNSAVINPKSYQSLDEFAAYLNSRPDVMIQLEGHTDFAGNAAANLNLSQLRADAVAEYLIKKGVKKSRITTKAFGGTQPLTLERTDEAMARNRRVEVRLTKVKS